MSCIRHKLYQLYMCIPLQKPPFGCSSGDHRGSRLWFPRRHTRKVAAELAAQSAHHQAAQSWAGRLEARRFGNTIKLLSQEQSSWTGLGWSRETTEDAFCMSRTADASQFFTPIVSCNFSVRSQFMVLLTGIKSLQIQSDSMIFDISIYFFDILCF